jgi:uncharacterized membrane protein
LVSLSEAKTYGGVGSLLVLLTPVPAIGWLLGIAGLVLMILAVKYFSDILSDKSIYNNIVTAIILVVGAIAVGSLVVYGSVLRVLGWGSFVGSSFFVSPTVPVGDWFALAAGIAAGLVVIWALLIASAVFIRRSYKILGSKLNVSTFNTAGLIYLIGAATAIIGVGFLLILVAQIMLAVAFFSVKESPMPMQSVQASSRAG